MSTPVRSQQELYQLFIDVLQDEAPDLTDVYEGSDIDALAGAFSIGGVELQSLVIDRFNKTFFDLAHGPEVTEGPDDLETLAVDHFGETFARPEASQAVDVCTFARPTTGAGDIPILAGTVVKTPPNANGVAQRYVTDADALLTGLNVTVGVTAVEAGTQGNAAAGAISVIETSLLDSSITVTNVGNQSGEDAEDDATYRETIRNLIEALSGATARAVAAKALTVAGVRTATPVERMLNVIEWDIGSGTPIGTYFRVPVPTLYIADASGSASQALIDLVKTAIDLVRALGVFINVASGAPVTVNWTAACTLNPLGPNYSTFSSSLQKIRDSMRDYVSALAVGTGFVRATARTAILAIWGPAGTNDLTDFVTSVPSGDIAAAATDKMIAGTMSTI